MSSHPYVTQQNTLLADDTTLMSTTDLHKAIYNFFAGDGLYLQELARAAAQHGASPDMPKAAFADMWFTPEKGEP